MEQLRFVAEKLSEAVTSSGLKIPDLRKLILNSKKYDEEMVRGMVDNGTNQARSRDTSQTGEVERQEKREEAERKHALELKKLEIVAKTSYFVGLYLFILI
ncbi:hypothetical protein HNY73_008877 [Argiope bruennichi]|uniref:Uncharacterized protein n=1 Tax=Argiope bruennichi TaxID=94029 RepID=A0A8T0FD76_ARGBR|nr:hypothetical protein HNY73_008877 [Argiope bruennichi]